jgi:purine-binding chemotaxis protein CheW
MGIVVDEVDQVMFLSEQHISPPPPLSQNGWIKGTYHHQDTLISLLNVDALLKNIDVNQVLVSGEPKKVEGVKK